MLWGGRGVANEQNLRPVRTKEEARKRGRNGGKKSGEVRRQKRDMRQYAELLLSLEVSNARDYNRLSAMGIPMEVIDNKMLVVAGLVKQAQKGDVAAVKELRNLIGEDKQVDTTVLDKLDSILTGVDGVMRGD